MKVVKTRAKQDWFSGNMENDHRVWQAGMLIYAITGWLNILFFSFCGIMAWQSKQVSVEPFLALFVLLGLVLLLSGGKVEVIPNTICHITAYGRFQLSWQEVISAAAGPHTLILEASSKRLVLPSPEVWSGEDKMQAEALLVQQLQANGFLRISRTFNIFVISRDCKV